MPNAYFTARDLSPEEYSALEPMTLTRKVWSPVHGYGVLAEMLQYTQDPRACLWGCIYPQSPTGDPRRRQSVAAFFVLN